MPSVFRNVRTRPKGFNYTPRYYDADKEDLEKRIRIIEKEVALESRESEKARIKMEHGIRHNWNRKTNSIKDRGRTLRLAVVLGMLLLIAKVIYNYL